MSTFDPFKDYESAGYLRNKEAEKDPNIVKKLEHAVFSANMEKAIKYLARLQEIRYQNFLYTHRILFEDFYPWAGQERKNLIPDSAIRKGPVLFSHPEAASLAVTNGLNMACDKSTMRKKHGEILGLFAYGHPFLDGNGRTMLLVHMELCHRAGFSIKWHETKKDEFLAALTVEIEKPAQGILNAYLEQYISEAVPRKDWGNNIPRITGLNSTSTDIVDGSFRDESISKKYKEFDKSRGYEL